MKRFATICLLAWCCSCTQYDLIIKNGLIHDGSGAAPFQADVAILDGKIAKIGSSLSSKEAVLIDAKGQVVCPGFIDVHAHLEPLALYPDAKSHIMQGVTSAVGGPDGGSPLPIGAYLDSLRTMGIGLNVGYLIGHNTVRNHVMGLVDRKPTDDELVEMKSLIQTSMKEGALGISTGLKYLPGTFAETAEIVALSKVASSQHGVYTSHLREEGLGLLSSVREAIQIANQASIRVILTHHKAIGEPMWGASHQTLALVDSARSKGLDIRIDQYPYTASHTGISVVIPPWSLEGGRFTRFSERAADPILRDSIKKGIIHNLINDRGGNDLRRVQFAKIDWKPEYAGKTLHDLVIDEMGEPTIENGAEMVIRIQEHRGANCIYHVIDPDDVKNIMAHPMTMIASDGRLTQYGKGHPHPRAYGTFPRVLGKYVREEQVITLPEAIRKMTSLPAESLQLDSRGRLTEGYHADITIFDPKEISDEATFQEPHQYPSGISYVIINGHVIVEGKTFHDIRKGTILKMRN
ncbi:MAG: D-aminoacylase [Saprospiraceae bacterium]|nr:D-aminoacylase [Saprospiraceae bacterium]